MCLSPVDKTEQEEWGINFLSTVFEEIHKQSQKLGSKNMDSLSQGRLAEKYIN